MDEDRTDLTPARQRPAAVLFMEGANLRRRGSKAEEQEALEMHSVFGCVLAQDMSMLVAMAETSHRRRYRNPPLQEAIIELQFHTGNEWNPSFFELLAERLSDFPHSETILHTSFVLDAEGIGLAPSAEARRFWREDRGMVLTVTQGLVAVSALPGQMHEGHSWERLRDTAQRVFKVYKEVVSPGPVRQSSVRYINVIPIEWETFCLGEWVNPNSGVAPDSLLEERHPFSIRVERITEIADAYLVREAVSLAAQGAPPAGARVILDVDEVSIWTIDQKLPDYFPLLERMHGAVHDVFTRVVRPEVLERFDPYDTD